MKTLLIIILTTGMFFSGKSQLSYNFSSDGNLLDSCNAYVNQDEYYPVWHTSHGSVKINEVTLSIKKYFAYFEGKKTNGTERTEGIFIENEFKCGREYEIVIYLASTSYNGEYFEICVANNLWERDDICSLGKIPSHSLDSSRIIRILDEDILDMKEKL